MLIQLSIPYPSTSLTAPPTDHIKFPIAAAAAKKPKTKKKLGQVRVHRHFKHKPKNISILVHVFCETGFVPNLQKTHENFEAFISCLGKL
jgi:hypothetical protein